MSDGSPDPTKVRGPRPRGGVGDWTFTLGRNLASIGRWLNDVRFHLAEGIASPNELDPVTIAHLDALDIED